MLLRNKERKAEIDLIDRGFTPHEAKDIVQEVKNNVRGGKIDSAEAKDMLSRVVAIDPK